ncbi:MULTISPECIES: hypothetical protein [unclassified Rhizobium]|uniref:hypothetical protein n=1 Tax=unclassified Rhizobium TaxID=2613769 RepID=UPI001AE9B3A4|nr:MULTISPECIES: hypothetical protein [unclassified Rhizobium]MBP2459589.1 hypothetical protein [Rhizobium sp. PvP014]MBP2531883.1 hypothetical protein [Rhizobium sp. PvP099]
MARVRFTKDFDYKPKSQVTIGYKADTEMTVRRECADAAIAAGKAVEVDGEGRDASPV